MSRLNLNQAYLDQLRKRYAKAGKKGRTAILDEFVATSRYHRKHAIALLRGHRGWRSAATRIHRARRRRYGEEDKRAVLALAEIFDQISSRRLRAALDTELPALRRQGHLPVSKACYGRLRVISLARMDRLRQGTPHPIRRRGGTKPGTLLKQQIPAWCTPSRNGTTSGLVSRRSLWCSTMEAIPAFFCLYADRHGRGQRLDRPPGGREQSAESRLRGASAYAP